MNYFKKLVGERIYLSPKGTSEEELQKFTEWMNDFQVTDYTGKTASICTLPGEKEWLEKSSMDSKSRTFDIVTLDENKLIGTVGLPPKNECTATMSGIVINTDGKLITCPYLLQAGYYKESDLPEFNEDFLNTWKNAKMYVDFRKNGQKGCQARSLIFSHDVKKGDPYDVEAYIKYKQAQA